MAIVVAVLAIGAAVFMWRQPASADAEGANAAQTSAAASSAPASSAVAAQAESQRLADATAALGPRTQSNLPPIPFQGYTPPRSPEIVTAAFHFAAEHPEILSYVPCFCGCERMGHRGNHDCFVKSRSAKGDVLEWEPHGVDCAVCIDVATRSRQMYASGASVKEIRAAIEKEYSTQFPSMTPTAHPHDHGHADHD